MAYLRTLIGIGLVVIVMICLYFGYTTILHMGINLAVAYDAWYMCCIHRSPYLATMVFFLLMESYNFLLLRLYYQNALTIIKIITIAQVSDVFQFIAGTRFGRNKIGWISKNKTFEGYWMGWLLTIGAYIFFLFIIYLVGLTNIFNLSTAIYEISIIYLLGVLGGLCSSLFKRILNIKDYSNLLGPHGGWVDRIDSIILPSIAFWFNFF